MFWNRQKSSTKQSRGVAPIEATHEAMNAAIAKAQATLPEFFSQLDRQAPNQESFLVKARVQNGDIVEHIWLADLEKKDGRLDGVIANETNFPGLAYMKPATIYLDQVTDWMFIEDGVLVGGFTTRVLRDRMSKEERQKFDRDSPYKFTN